MPKGNFLGCKPFCVFCETCEKNGKEPVVCVGCFNLHHKNHTTRPFEIGGIPYDRDRFQNVIVSSEYNELDCITQNIRPTVIYWYK